MHGFRRRSVDPGGGRFGEGHGRLISEPRGVRCKRAVKRDLPNRVNSDNPVETHLIGVTEP